MDATKVDLIMLSMQKIIIWLANNILIVSTLAIIIYLANFFLPSPIGEKKQIRDESKFGNRRANCSWLKCEVEGQLKFFSSVVSQEVLSWDFLGVSSGELGGSFLLMV